MLLPTSKLVLPHHHRSFLSSLRPLPFPLRSAPINTSSPWRPILVRSLNSLTQLSILQSIVKVLDPLPCPTTSLPRGFDWKLINNHHQQPRLPSSKRLPSLSTLSAFSTLSTPTPYRQRLDSLLHWPSRILFEQTTWSVLPFSRSTLLRILNRELRVGRGRQL